MIDATSQAVLQDVFRRVGRSLLQYVGEAYPWVSAREQPVLDRLRALIDEDNESLAELARFLQRKHVPVPYLGAFPEAYTAVNYIALAHLLPMLVEDRRSAVVAMERDVREAADPDVRAHLQKVLALNREHLKALEALAVADKAPAA